MPQGAFKNKKKADKPFNTKKGKHQRPLKIKRGSKAIAPKKANAVEGMIVQKNLQKAINAQIEQEMKERASKDATGFKLFKREKPKEFIKKIGK